MKRQRGEIGSASVPSWRRWWVAAGAVVVLGGLAVVIYAMLPSADERSYLSYVKDTYAGIGQAAANGAISDRDLVSLGKDACASLSQGTTVQELMQAELHRELNSESRLSFGDYGGVLDAASHTFCPEHADVVRAGRVAFGN